MKKSNGAILVCSMALALNACSSGGALSLSKRPPDEFRVISNPPLTVPPSFDLTDPNKPAEQVVQADRSELTGSEKEFIKSLHTSSNPTVEPAEHNDGAIKGFFKKLKGKPAENVIDPVAEHERIKKNKAEGVAINKGDVVTRKTGKSTLDKVLGNDD